ncbi:MAG: hypothetical protein K6T78_10940 [Alicyclobacillus sp.]|nr:hypothetical protein [Alicyclobacillus sp.]
MERWVHGVRVRGVEVDEATRCRHYHKAEDVVAIRFPCCDTYYPCHACHEETAGHEAARWPASRLSERAVLCGACGTELTISAYVAAKDHCPVCQHPFNPRCASHYELYFELPSEEVCADA